MASRLPVAHEIPAKDYRVLKFGGTSVATVETLRQVVSIVTDSRELGPTIVVASAIRGVTDDLVAGCQGPLHAPRILELVERLRRRHLDGLEDWLSSARLRALAGRLQYELDRLARALSVGPQLHEVLAAGERLSVVRLATCLDHAGLEVEALDGTEVLTRDLDGTVHNRRVEAGLERLRTVASRPGTVALVPGFVASDHYGRTVTLGRGASDLSATALAHLLDAGTIEIWTDTPGILSADPRQVLGARTLAWLHPEEAAALARYGARVLHPEALVPVAGKGGRVRVLSTLERDHPGTEIQRDRPRDDREEEEGLAKSISVLDLAEGEYEIDLDQDRPVLMAALVHRGKEEAVTQILRETLWSRGQPTGRSFVEPAGPSSLVVVGTVRRAAEELLSDLHTALCDPTLSNAREPRASRPTALA